MAAANSAAEGDRQSQRERGDEIRRRVLGASAGSPTSAIAPILRQISEEVQFGMIWTRPELDLMQRSMVTIAALVAMGKEAQLATNIRGGLNVGLTREQILEVIVQLAMYVGMPTANTALAVAKRVFDDIDARPPAAP